MSMRRNSITVNESGNIIMPENVSNIWMSEPELVELFGVIAPTLRSAIRNIYNSGALKRIRGTEVCSAGERVSCRCVQLSDDSRTCFPH